MNESEQSEREPQKCLSCGAIIAPGTLENLCPACLLANVIGDQTDADDKAETLRVGELADTVPSEILGERIGRYKLLQKIGEGGCGVVYMAEQEEPVRRRVALKVIKLGMDTRQVIARFEAERQALAMMDHPNIAKVFDAGATETGRPYFVMELVKGIRITDYCDQNKLSPRERLELFKRVCQAIQHAHQKGIIHRDIKPSNILVTLHDGVPVPKVIDFGIAKATDQQLTDKTLFTAFGQFIGTPAYMSPEQAELSGLDIDTRTDIYSLGVLLYELLTGSTPFDTSELIKRGLDEIRRNIREVEPPRPSIKLSTLTSANLTAVATARSVESLKLCKQVRGDLDWIVMKAMEKDRTRRYEAVNGLAQDVTRHLNNEPILARPPSGAYILSKVIRRHKFAFYSSAAVATSLIVALGVSAWLLAREKEARRRAVAAQEEQKHLAMELDEVVWMLLDGSLAKAEKLIHEALPAQRKIVGDDGVGWLAALAEVRQRQGKFAEAEEPIREALAILEKKAPNHWGVFYLQIMLGGSLLEEKKYAEAEPLLLTIRERTMKYKERLLVPDSHSPKQATLRLVQLYTGWGKLEKAAEWQQKLDAFKNSK